MNPIKTILSKIGALRSTKPKKFDTTGERVDILYSSDMGFDAMDMYQKSHFRRYEFACDLTKPNETCGDFACGTGYGSIMISTKAKQVIGADINGEVITDIRKRYKSVNNVEFIQANLLDLKYESKFERIISFETIEHFTDEHIARLLQIFFLALKPGGQLIFSTPYMQEESEMALKLGHHHSFYINEEKIERWLGNAGFRVQDFKYQNYETHDILNNLESKDFIICVAAK